VAGGVGHPPPEAGRAEAAFLAAETHRARAWVLRAVDLAAAGRTFAELDAVAIAAVVVLTFAAVGVRASRLDLLHFRRGDVATTTQRGRPAWPLTRKRATAYAERVRWVAPFRSLVRDFANEGALVGRNALCLKGVERRRSTKAERAP
jgi:hypothetical protein